MSKRKVFKKLLSSILVAIIVLGQFSGYQFKSIAASEANVVNTLQTDGPIYISLSETNTEENIGYAFGMQPDGSLGKHIWTMMSSANLNGDSKIAASNIYCIKAEYGQTWEGNGADIIGDTTKPVEYNSSYALPLTEQTEWTVADNILFGDYQNAILWLIDNLYIPGESTESDFIKYLNNAGIFYENNEYSYDLGAYDFIANRSDDFAETVTEEDIIAVQQAALWYFTNYAVDGTYDKIGENTWLQYTTSELLASDDKYEELSDLSTGRAVHATVIYNYLVNEAIAVAEEYEGKTYQLQNNTAKLWTATNSGNFVDEQPVIEVHKQPTFDLSLRKTIVEVKDKAGNVKNIVNANEEDATRNVVVDAAALINETDTTAEYKHRKDPVVVKTGDTVKYALTIYNEGEQAGYATIIKDQLPGTWDKGLRLISSNGQVTAETTGNIYDVKYETETNTVILTMAESSPKNVLAAYDGEGTPESETIYIECKVMGNPDTQNSKILTNIAYIAQDYNAETTTYQDRDSHIDQNPQDTLITEDLGYTGKNDETDLSDNNKYYEGQEDDDDFEKIVILPESFDLSLRKNITKVNGEALTEESDRTPTAVTTDLKNEDDTTADYNHRKDPIIVKTGDIVEYNITIYNEGTTAGVASKINDQLPTGLILQYNEELFTKVENEYFVTSTTGNTYKVEYDTENNVVTFTLVETDMTKINLLDAYDNTDNLNKEVITLQCKVEATADIEEKTYLTNIAYIAEAKRYDGTATGTIVTTQDAENADEADEADRDSEPANYPTADSLNTIGELGYTGKETITNPEDLANSNKHYEGIQDDDDFEKLVIFPEKFDLSLRKNITKVNDDQLDDTRDRNPVADTTNLNATENDTTADYNHKKDPVLVKDGDIVEYNITIYNEGSRDGIATTIVDKLPAELILHKAGENNVVTSANGNNYQVTYENNTITFTLISDNPTLLKAYSSNGLDKDVITLQCKVDCKADNDQDIYLTNIAYIAAHKADVNGTLIDIVEDRDSQPTDYPTADSLKTEGELGYTGKEQITNPEDLADSNKYYEGQEDDDDFEKLVIRPETFDLSLRKYITEVDGIVLSEETETTRNPEIDTSKLGSSTTADYNHRKDPVVVVNGSKVKYNISLYNEGSIAGVATIIKDQLPIGLKLNMSYFDKVEGQYFVTSSKDGKDANRYEVKYDEASNLVEFILVKSETTQLELLKAYDGGEDLDEETIELECIVDYVAHEEKNTYFTNIAYIFEAEQEDGTIVKNQEPGSGADSDRDSKPADYPIVEDLTTEDIGYTGKEDTTELSNPDKYYKGQEDDDDFEKLVMLPKDFDLKLIKFISSVNGEATENRVITIDTSKLNTIDEQTGNKITTAEYILEKNPVAVKGGDFITYTIRVYNEGDYDGYATEISEDIPEGLEFFVIIEGTDGKRVLSWDGKEEKDVTDEIKSLGMFETIVETNQSWGYDGQTSIIITNALSEDLLKGFGQENVEYADAENKIDYKEIEVIFRVKQDVEANVSIRNEAAISEDKVVDNNKEIDIDDRDSNTEEWKKEDSDKTYDEEKKWPIYKEDDEDYDNIVTKSFDLSLRKQIVYINDAMLTQRYAHLLEQADEKTLYDYYNVYTNKPKVKAGDIVVYSIRVYNEGEIDGYASLIVDTLPSGLEFYSSEHKGIDYGWTLVEGTENTYQTDYLSYEKDANKGTENSTIIKAYDGEGEADYQDIYIVCKVKEDVSKEDSLLNVAQIADDSDEDGRDINDKDSIPGSSDDETKWKEEDDLDIEILQLQEFDLALRKFITKIENSEKIKEVTSRIPQVSYDEESKELVYTHTKDALVVHVGDTVIYTIRVYNEGEIDGYAAEVKDDIPEYLEYLPEHSTNVENEWVMYDEEGNVTDDVTKAVFIKTKHLAKGNGVEADDESEETNLLEAFDPESELSDKNPDYRDVEVAFKVKDPNSTEYEIVNFAQISEDTDSKGEEIKDKDSETDNGKDEPKEDDEDIEKVKVEYFDLSLLKYVTKAIVIENGQERVIETGNVGDENDIVARVSIDKKNVNNVIVKFAYTIKITNEGQIAGEATEITDYVPEGLIFVAEDNEHWIDEGNNVISTKQLTGSTLQPGESVEVEVILRWINGADNLGTKVNVAEISEDHNEESVPDKDSTPDNKEELEDDIDEAEVILDINLGGGIQTLYINLIITFLVVILIGGILIKKFVL